MYLDTNFNKQDVIIDKQDGIIDKHDVIPFGVLIFSLSNIKYLILSLHTYSSYGYVCECT